MPRGDQDNKKNSNYEDAKLELEVMKKLLFPLFMLVIWFYQTVIFLSFKNHIKLLILVGYYWYYIDTIPYWYGIISVILIYDVANKENHRKVYRNALYYLLKFSVNLKLFWNIHTHTHIIFFLIYFSFLAVLHSMWYLIPLMRDGNPTPCRGSTES